MWLPQKSPISVCNADSAFRLSEIPIAIQPESLIAELCVAWLSPIQLSDPIHIETDL